MQKNAQIYGLKVLRNSIQNNKNNSTRFIVVTGKKVYTDQTDRISICFEINHESGALYHALSHFIYNGLNMTNIQSRPLQNKNWEYRFFVDFEGRFEDHCSAECAARTFGRKQLHSGFLVRISQ